MPDWVQRPLGHDSFLVALRITRATLAHFRIDRVFQMADAAEEVPKCEVEQQHRQRDGDANRKECRCRVPQFVPPIRSLQDPTDIL